MFLLFILLKPGPDSIGIVAVSSNCSGVAARACGLVSLEPAKVFSFNHNAFLLKIYFLC